MESFLSLPRSAKAGLAVLLAVALLGWGIVAYSSKRQHEDAESLRQALVTLDRKAEAEQTVTTELEGLSGRLTTAETDLSATLNEKVDLEDEVSKLRADLKKREEIVADLTGRLESLEASGSNADDNTQALGLLGKQAESVDVATLRERLTKARTTLSARSATLAQRDRDLERANADYEAATNKIATLEADLIEQGVLRERLTTAMTTLSGRTATLAQRDRELERIKADYETATATIASLEADLVEQGVLRERLTKSMTSLSGRTATLAQRDRELELAKADYEAATATIEALEADLVEQGILRQRLTSTMTKLSGLSATLAQRDRALARLSEQNETMLAKLTAFETDAVERDRSGDALSGLQSKVDQSKAELEKTEAGLQVNQQNITASETRLESLKSEVASIEATVEAKKEDLAKRETDLLALGQQISAEEKRLADLVSTSIQQKNEIEEVEEELNRLKEARANVEADINSLQAEYQQQEASLTGQRDEFKEADARLTDLKDEVRTAEERIAEIEAKLAEKSKEFGNRQRDVDAVEATLAALKQDQEKTETENVELRNVIGEREAVLVDLAVAKGDLEKTRTELGYQQAILDERQEQIRLADSRLGQLSQAVDDRSGPSRSVATMPIAALSSDNVAVLPIDPLYEPFPIQTPIGIRLTQVHFDMGSAELTPGGLRKAQEAADWIKAQDVEKIRLVGFTDSIGTEENNLSLAERRATSMLRVFEGLGIDPEKIEIIAKGEVGAREITDDQTSEPLNRCVGVFIGADG